MIKVAQGKPVMSIVTGRVVDMLDPTLPVITAKTLQPN